ncbi:MAG: hypothetical protein IK144_11975 [Bacteroidaceae bacterium]|nr:hypothetical protein [Bacteroidaceae bacterium]
MESTIKVKATRSEWNIIARFFCVKYCYESVYDGVRKSDGKSVYLYKIDLRHAEEVGRLRGTYTAQGLVKKLAPEHPYIGTGYVDDIITDLATIKKLFGNDLGLKQLLIEKLQAA